MAEYHDWGFPCKGCGKGIVLDANRLSEDSSSHRNNPFEDVTCKFCGKSFNYFDDQMIDLGLSNSERAQPDDVRQPVSAIDH